MAPLYMRMWKLAAGWAAMIGLIMLHCLPIEPAKTRTEVWISRAGIVTTAFTFLLWSSSTIYILSLYRQPSERVSGPLLDTASAYLDCAKDTVPTLRNEWGAIETCIRSVTVYHLTPGQLPVPPRQGGSLAAFVVRRLDRSSVFAAPLYSKMLRRDKALALIHECAHLALDAEDYAYIWENKFVFLTDEQQRNNADSYMDRVIYHCV